LKGNTVYLSYDPHRNIAYLRLREAADAELETVKVSDELNIDLALEGSVYGIELLNANAQMRGGDQGNLTRIRQMDRGDTT